MKIMKVRLKERSYPIIIGNQVLSQLGARLKKLNIGRDAVVITNSAIKRRHGMKLSSGLIRKGFTVKYFEVPDGEKSKSAKYAFELMNKIAAYDINRNLFVIAFGGGVVGDLAGYVAAAYKRGIPYVQVPTTLLAQIDSAIGGKVGIDLPVGKNLVGAFYQPKLVLSDISVLKTLSPRQIRNGLAEAVKYGIIRDAKLFRFIERNYRKLLAKETASLVKVISVCSRIKADVVERDEKETKGIRMILNFGHTTAHAVESASRYKHYEHGEAVGLGMRVAADISRRRKLLGYRSMEKINQLISNVGLPEKIRGIKVHDILSAMQHDKKFRAGRNRFVLATKIGSVKVVENISRSTITSAIRKYYS